MPYVNIKITCEGGRTERDRHPRNPAQLIKGVTDLLSDVLGRFRPRPSS